MLATGSATDDVRAAVELPPGLNPKLFGAGPKDLAESGIIRSGGFVRTARPQGHARPVLFWELADRAAAPTWLVDPPDLPERDANEPAQRTLFNLTSEPGREKSPGSHARINT
jgi:hypothetical protein